MKERQRWRSEEDAILRAYVKSHGPREWHLVSQRMGSPLDRDAKSCLERWKNYLKPGIKKGSLTEQEQRLVISLQAKHGNKWKLIASEVPGRTAKRLGKWWEVFKDKESKKKFHDDLCHISTTTSSIQPGKYDRILENFAEKLMPHDVISPPPMQLPPPAWPPSPCVALTLGSAAAAASAAPCTVNSIGECCRELQEAHMELMAHRKEAGWRLKRVEIQLESEKAGKKREKMEEVEARIRALREEERMELERIEADYREQMGTSRKQVEAKEVKMVDQWAASHAKLGNLVGELGVRR